MYVIVCALWKGGVWQRLETALQLGGPCGGHRGAGCLGSAYKPLSSEHGALGHWSCVSVLVPLLESLFLFPFETDMHVAKGTLEG